MEYDKKDKLILESLYHNWRLDSSKISRKVRLSRRQVDYRIKNYFSSGVIRSIFTVFDYAKLGFNKPAYIFIKLANKKYFEEIGNYLEKTKRCTSWGKVWTKYDIFSNFIFKDSAEMSQIIKEIKGKFKDKVEGLKIIDPEYAEFFPLKSIGNELNETYTLTNKAEKKEQLDNLDIKILKEISSNARKPIIGIAEKIGISPERCLYRLRNLVKKKIILGSRIQFDLKNAGYLATCLFIETKLSPELIEKLKFFCAKNEYVNYLIISKKEPQIIIQAFHKDAESLREIIKEISEILSKQKFNLELVELEDDINLINPVPFLK